jgi:molybdenum-dependent DNA-binding transcriptional regulator ModE
MPAQRISDDLLRQAAAAVRQHGNITAAARSMGMPRSTLEARVREAISRLGETVPSATERMSRGRTGIGDARPVTEGEHRDILRLREQVRTLGDQLKEIRRDNLDAETVRTSLLGLAARSPEPPKWLVAATSGKGITGVPSTIWSDWHIGEVVTLGETNGVNEYSLAIAEARIRRLVERTIDLCFHHMTNPKFPGIVVNILGDIVSGEIHQELAETNEQELFPVILWTVERLTWALSALADRFGSVFVPCVSGNHGRMTKKPQAKRYVYKNADWLIYCLLERHFKAANDRRIQFLIPEANEVFYRVYGTRYMGLHGDDLGVKGGDGIIGAIGPIMRGEIKVANSSSQINRGYDMLMMGHWHQTLFLPRATVNNTLKGFDEYARRMLRAPASPPAQVLWFTHPTRGITARWEIVLEEAKREQGAAWVSVPAAA